MTRIEPVRPGRGPLFVRFAHAAARWKYGRPVEPIGVYGHSPLLLAGYACLEQATGRLHRVDERLKALAVARVASLCNCEYCIDIGSALARDSGVTEAQLLALPDYPHSDEFGELERLVLDLATAMTVTPTAVSDELFASLREHFDERQLTELANEIALENLRARFNTAFAMTPDRFSEGMVCVRPAEAVS